MSSAPKMEEDQLKNNPSEENVESSEDDTSQSEAELMVTTRTRRVTAGNRYSALVAQEEPEENEEDEVAMLFAEGEGEDDDFNSDEGDEDADMSSSDDDDQGPNVAADDLDGEQEIQKEKKVERAKKRKADLALTTISGLRKKPRIDPTSVRRAAAPKPSKRKERVSWLPESDLAPGRISLRKQTILHRAETHAKLKVNEEQRLRSKARREKRELEREAAAPKEMTQADRLAGAERVERRNAKSLNRWEAMEKKRAEEQAAKLAALKDRKLDGAFVTWYSSKAKYIGLKEVKNIEIEIPTEPKKRGRKPKALLEQLAAARLANEQRAILAPNHVPTTESSQTPSHDTEPPTISSNVSLNQVDAAPSASPGASTTSPAIHAGPSSTTDPTPEPRKESDVSFLTGIHDYASMPSEVKSKESNVEGKIEAQEVSREPLEEPNPLNVSEEVLSPTKQINEPKTSSQEPSSSTSNQQELQVETSEVIQRVERKASETALPATVSDRDTASNNVAMSDINSEPAPANEVGRGHTDKAVQPDSQTEQVSLAATTDVEKTQSVPAPINISERSLTAAPPIEVISTRNLVILDRFDDISEQVRQDFGLFYNNRKTGKPVKHSQELCPVTGLQARYRDPITGIAYANAAAYKKLQELKKHNFTWSGMLGCYVGRSDIVARGVPEGFLGH